MRHDFILLSLPMLMVFLGLSSSLGLDTNQIALEYSTQKKRRDDGFKSIKQFEYLRKVRALLYLIQKNANCELLPLLLHVLVEHELS